MIDLWPFDLRVNECWPLSDCHALYSVVTNGPFLRADNFATVDGRKVCDMPKVSEFCLEKVQNGHASAFRNSLHSLQKLSLHMKLSYHWLQREHTRKTNKKLSRYWNSAMYEPLDTCHRSAKLHIFPYPNGLLSRIRDHIIQSGSVGFSMLVAKHQPILSCADYTFCCTMWSQSTNITDGRHAPSISTTCKYSTSS